MIQLFSFFTLPCCLTRLATLHPFSSSSVTKLSTMSVLSHIPITLTSKTIVSLLVEGLCSCEVIVTLTCATHEDDSFIGAIPLTACPTRRRRLLDAISVTISSITSSVLLFSASVNISLLLAAEVTLPTVTCRYSVDGEDVGKGPEGLLDGSSVGSKQVSQLARQKWDVFLFLHALFFILSFRVAISEHS